MPKLGLTSIKRNTLINLAGSIVPILVSLITVPLYLQVIGQARYGVLAIVWVLLGYFGFLDLGLGRAITNHIAKLRDVPSHEIETLFWTALLVNAAFGVLGAGIMLVGGHVLLGSVFKIPVELQVEALSALPWLVVAVPVITISSVLFGTLEGQERFLTANVLGVVSTLLFQVVPLVVAFWIGPRTEWLIASIVLIRLMSTIWAFMACAQYVPLTGRPRFKAEQLGSLLHYGGWITVTAVINPFLVTLDHLVIGAQAGVQALPSYSIPYNLVTQVLILPTSLSRTLFPRFSMLRGDAGRAVGREMCMGLAVLITPIIVFAIVLLKPFLKIWLGATLADTAAPVGQILLVGVWFNSLAFIPYTLLQGQGRPDLTAKFHALELIPYVLALWLGWLVAGLKGVACAWTLRVVVDAMLLLGAARVPSKQMAPLLPAALIVLLASVSSLILTAQLVWYISIGVTIGLLSLLWAWYAAPQQLKILPYESSG